MKFKRHKVIMVEKSKTAELVSHQEKSREMTNNRVKRHSKADLSQKQQKSVEKYVSRNVRQYV